MLSNETRVAQLVLAHHAFVKALAFKLAPWPGLVDDISQQVFLEFLAKQEKWNLEQDLRPLLAKMTRHVAARYWRIKLASTETWAHPVIEGNRVFVKDSEVVTSWVIE